MADLKDLLYRIRRSYYIEISAQLAPDPDEDQIVAIVVIKKWHPGWWLLKRKLARVDRAFIGAHAKGRVR